MAKKRSVDTGRPKFPYTTEPKALRRLLAEIPKRPRPPKVTLDVIKAWNVSKNNNARTAINVLKRLGLLSDAGEPTDIYTEYMKTGVGPIALGNQIRSVYQVLFQNVHAPQDESDEEIQKLFNIHSGGAEDAMRLQIQTFKALADHAKFDSNSIAESGADVNQKAETSSRVSNGAMPPVQIDLHIHLPENKTSRDYEAIIQDIARYIYGREIQ